MAAKTNLTKAADIKIRAREIDFVTRFSETWRGFADIMGIMRPIAKAPGTTLTSYKASITLEDGDVGDTYSISEKSEREAQYADSH